MNLINEKYICFRNKSTSKKVSDKFLKLDAFSIALKIKEGKVGVISTDRLYGLVGSALIPKVVNKIYRIKKSKSKKPLTIYISDVEQIKYFGIELTKELLLFLRTYWPGSYSIILRTTLNDEFNHLSRGTGKLCFHMPDCVELFELIDFTGPLLATSANIHGEKPATTVDEAYKYFGDKVDFYSDSGLVCKTQNCIIEYADGKAVTLRK